MTHYLSCSFDEKRYTSACVEPPTPKLFFAQMDSLNDCLVIENLAQVAEWWAPIIPSYPAQQELVAASRFNCCQF